MNGNTPSSDAWSSLSKFVAEKMGLHFPPEQWPDLERGVKAMASEFGVPNTAGFIDWLLTTSLTKEHLQKLAAHLTVGETYFFRHKNTFAALAESALPELIRVRRKTERRLRLWSAACCTGEEAYSIAILLRQTMPDLADWKVTILATDINEQFLQKAATGVYGEWSFRESPPHFKERYFRRLEDGRYMILPEIKQQVTFMQLNLVEDHYPTLLTDTNAMDVIFCRNVLMYFTVPQAKKVVRKLYCAMVEDGWLAVSPCEVSQVLFGQFVSVNLSHTVLYQKAPAQNPIPLLPTPPGLGDVLPIPFTVESSSPDEPLPKVDPSPTSLPLAVAASLYEEGQYAEAANTLLNSMGKDIEPKPGTFSLLTRSLANQGKLTDALVSCDQWIAADKLDASAHYLRAVILQELGDTGNSRQALQKAAYLRPDFILVHFTLGNLARARGRNGEAVKHFNNASRLLGACSPEDVLPESDGLTARRLTEIIASIGTLEGKT